MYGDDEDSQQPRNEQNDLEELDSEDDEDDQLTGSLDNIQNPEGLQNFLQNAQDRLMNPSSPSQKTTSPDSDGRTRDSLVEPMEAEKKPEDEEEDDEPALEPTHLGNAIDSLMMHWCQLLTNVSVRAPIPPPSTADHVKEVAEVCSKHFRDASVDVTNEFLRIGVQWEMEQAAEQFIPEEKDLDEAIQRQETLLEMCRQMLGNRVTAFEQQHPDAGKHFIT